MSDEAKEGGMVEKQKCPKTVVLAWRGMRGIN